MKKHILSVFLLGLVSLIIHQEVVAEPASIFTRANEQPVHSLAVSYEDSVSFASAPIIRFKESKNDGVFLYGKKQVIVGKKSPYEIFEFSISETPNEITFSIESNLPLEGLPEPRARNKHVGYGDLMLYYKNAKIGIKFAGRNKGIYSNITTINNTENYFGSKTPQIYINRLKSASVHDSNRILPPEWVTHVGRGALLSKEVEVEQVMENQYHHIQITVSKKDLPKGSFTAYLPTECINDYVLGEYALASELTNDEAEVPNDLSSLPMQNGLRDLRLNTVPIIWLLLREVNPIAGILSLRKSLTTGTTTETTGTTTETTGTTTETTGTTTETTGTTTETTGTTTETTGTTIETTGTTIETTGTTIETTGTTTETPIPEPNPANALVGLGLLLTGVAVTRRHPKEKELEKVS
jgi:hypothetical protein